MSLQQLLIVLRARAGLIARIFVAVTIVGTLAAFLLPRNYTASVPLLIDAKSANALLGAMLPPQMLGGYMATQVDIITSPRVTERAAARPEIAQDAYLQAQWRDATEEEVPFEVWMGNRLQHELQVKPSQQSNVVVLSYKCRHAERCARIANAVASAYIETNLEIKVAPAREYAQWFDARTRSMRENMEAAQRKLSDYQREHGIIATEERLDVETSRLDELSRQLVAIQAERSSSTARRGQTGNAENLPEVVQSPLITGLKGELGRLQAQRSQLTSRLGKKHPEIVRLDREIASLSGQIAAETRHIVGSIDTTDRVNTDHEASMRKALDEQRARVLELKAQRDEISVLQKDVENAQRAYDLVTGRLAETSLESEAQQTNVTVLSPATAATLPSSPRRLVMVALAMMLGMVAGVALALILEMIRRPVRTEVDVIDATGVPVLGVVPRALVLRPVRGLLRG